MSRHPASASTPASTPASRQPLLHRLPLPELIAFEAAARLGGFAAAAGELALSQSAVSHRVRQLEAKLGVALFERRGRRVSLSAAGARHAAAVAAQLAALRQQATTLRTAEGERLRIEVAPLFGSRWLLPRLATFRRQHPRLVLEVAPAPLAEADLMIHPETNPRADGVPLQPLRIGAYAAPALAERCSVLLAAGRLTDLPLIHAHGLNWERWLRGALGTGLTPPGGLEVDDPIAAMEAALAGAGALLAPALAAEPLVAQGRLCAIHPWQQEAGQYHGRLSAAGRHKPAAAALLAWLQEQP
ncbi:LysR family transcriptional regulator [Azoarcus indigens]|uniref:LysR family glycine cleavage system transcriptional activator n=1 Tax=Azoarcus indigens TaxID=29545 RepID=A0A4R6E600_9RHOO|nr:LysR family transcriptional regulator [Azoarcus indigens]NMG66045.1 LysR family transcriptional regulator [Azoarcus indigens]TDN53335.1 LysR family glycine cleavage system transcriptional activator [Azoarcus indigens]